MQKALDVRRNSKHTSNMTAKTSTERGRDYRRRQKLKQLEEVRGIWARKVLHKAIKEAAKQFGAETKK